MEQRKKFWISLSILFTLLLTLIAFGLLIFREASDPPPLIGISYTGQSDYARAVLKAGGKPILLDYDLSQIEGHLQELDGLLLPGGDDIPPQVYGEEPHPTVVLVSENRYQFESSLAKAWLEQTDKPLLGICLGCQLINVVQGGTLFQDIPSQLGGDHRTRHMVAVERTSRLAAMVVDLNFEVTSNHHQSVKELGQGLRVAALAPDGVIEAIELIDSVEARFVLGVQWHPEIMRGDARQERIFKAFVENARALREEKKERVATPALRRSLFRR